MISSPTGLLAPPSFSSHFMANHPADILRGAQLPLFRKGTFSFLIPSTFEHLLEEHEGTLLAEIKKRKQEGSSG